MGDDDIMELRSFFKILVGLGLVQQGLGRFFDVQGGESLPS